MELSELSLFKGIGEKECYQLMSCLEARIANFRHGEILAPLNSAGKIGVVCEGIVRLVRTDRDGNEALLEVLAEDSVFGEATALLGATSEGLYAIAEEAATVLFVNYANLTKRCKNLCTCHAQLLENLLRLSALKTMSLCERITVITNRSIRGKLMCYFQMMSAKQKSKTVLLPFGFSDLAEYLCVDRSAMTRELSKIKREGIIRIVKRKVTLL